jgi:hypothetical protein
LAGIPAIALLAIWGGPSVARAEGPTATAQAGFDAYIRRTETRLDAEQRSPETYLHAVDWKQARAGQPVVEELTRKDENQLPGALIHDWRGTAFAPGATAADFERVLRDFAAYPREFAPQVLQAHVLASRGDHAQVVLRVRQKHVLTVVLDTAYDVTYARLDSRHGTIASRSTHVAEIGADGHPLSTSDEHGYLWRMNTYWSYEERNGGVYMQLESVSLTRSIPTGLGWAVGPFVESIPRESTEFTLRAVLAALKK